MPSTILDAVRREVGLSTLLICCAAFPAVAATDDENVQAEIKGFISRDGKPVGGLVISSCADVGSSLDPKFRCEKPIRVTTDRFGRFQFLKFIGSYPPQSITNHCTPQPGCSLVDPGWRYWFKLVDGNRTRIFSKAGMGYGVAYARLDCQLPSRQDAAERLNCEAIEVQLEVPRPR